jgi:hypothetical protein
MLIGAICIGTTATTVAGIHAYPELGPKIAYSVVDILIKHGMPMQHDREDKWFRIGSGATRWIGGSPSYTVYLYEAHEIPLAAQVEIIDYCLRLYASTGHKNEIHIEMRTEAFEPKLFKPTPYFELILKSNEQ